MVASLDEFHQSFLPNRTGIPSDVLLDCCGAVVLLSLYLLIRMLRSKRRFERAA
jgi:VanZ family protein